WREAEKHTERRRDALSAGESEEAGVEVAEERRDADERDRGGPEPQAFRGEYRDERLQRVADERQQPGRRACRAHDVRRTDVAAPDVARIDAASAAQQDPGRNRAADIREGDERKREHSKPRSPRRRSRER